MSSTHASKLRRLNGRLQACDPCRRRKVACDHGQPVCLRCKRKGLDGLCSYTISARSVAPLDSLLASPTSTRSPTSPAGSRRPPRSRHSASASQFGGSQAQTPGATPAPNSSSRSPGYLGFASYTTVFEEARKSLSASGEGLNLLQTEASDANLGLAISDRTLDSCVAVLQQLPTVDNTAILGAELFVYNSGTHHIATQICNQLYDPRFFGSFLGKRRDPNQLRHMARIICANTAKPVVDDVANAAEWIGQFSGANVRWESIGILFGFWDTTRRVYQTEYTTPQDDSDEWLRSRDAISRCLELCDEYSHGNILLVFLYRRRAGLESMSSGDASLRTWKFHAETIACLTFLGYHAEKAKEPYVPTFVSELRRLLCASVHAGDKTVASFTGRPPLLPRSFYSTPLPLDLPDDCLFGSQADLSQHVALRLDPRGWSTTGELGASTCYRARSMVAGIRSDILEIALGGGGPNDDDNNDNERITIADLQSIKARQIALFAEFPPSLAHDPASIADHAVKPGVVFTKLLLRMEALLNDFFVDRLLLKRGCEGAATSLLLTSFDLVCDTLVLWTNFERFAKMKRDFEWILMAYGAPAGGILCKELQKPTFRGRHHHPADRRVTRSAIIQKLSLLVGFLDWVDPLAPNADLCGDCKAVIRLVLDQALNHDNGGNVAEEEEEGEQGGEAGRLLEYEFPAGLDFNFELLDSFDWLVGDGT